MIERCGHNQIVFNLSTQSEELTLLIRSITEQDYPRAVEIHNAQNELHFQTTLEQMQRSDEVKRRSDLHYERYVAEKNGEVIATGYLTPTWAGTSVAGRVWVGIFTRADHRNTGVDTRLLEHALAKSEQPIQEIWSCVRSDFVPMSGYLEGFTEQFRSYGGELDLSQFDAAKFQPLVKRLGAEGVTIKPYADLSNDAERDENLLALHAETEADAPYHAPIIPAHHPDIHSPEMNQSSVFVAVRNGQYVGYVGLEKSESDQTAIAFLGVSRPYRNQRIGTALGVLAAEFAKSKYTELNAGGGAKENVTMQRVLHRLGFEIEPDWVTFSKRL